MRPRAAWEGLSQRNRRALAFGAVVVGLALAWTAGVSPWLAAVSERSDHLASRRDLLQAERDLLASADVYRQAVRAGAGRLRSAADGLLSGRSEGVAAAGLEQLVRDRAAAHRVLVTATAPRDPGRAIGGLLPVGLELQGESDLQGVAGLLASLEGGEMLLRVSDLRIRRSPAVAGRPPALGFRAVLTGYRLAREGGTSDAGAARASGSDPAAARGGGVASRRRRP